jgi:hypothetical protein
MVQQLSTADTSLVTVLLEREERMRLEMEAKAEQLRQEVKAEKAVLRQEAKAEKEEQEAKAAADKAELRREMQQQMDKMREELKPAEAISEQRLAALQARIDALHQAKLLGDDELYALEDLVADYVELESSMGVALTLETIHANENASKLLKLVGLSEHIAADSAFSRQARRKYV